MLRRNVSDEQIRATFDPVERAEGEVALIPFPPASIPDAWNWLNEFPKANFDDDGPKNEQEFAADLMQRVKSGTTIFGVRYHGKCVGIIGFTKVTKRLGHFSGICFSKSVHGKGIAYIAIALLLRLYWSDGLQKIEAMHFADNQRILRLFLKLGGQQEGLLRNHAMRNGVPIDCRLVGFLRPEVS